MTHLEQMMLKLFFGFALAGLLVACAGGGNRFAPPAESAGQALAPSLSEPSASGLLGEPNASALLYVSDPSGGGVAFYSYPYGHLVGRITKFYQPAGMCVSKTGDVFIADQQFSRVRVYAHGGTKLLRSLADPGYSPLGCAIDPVTGNLAVTSYTGAGHHGSLAIYPKAMGPPKVHFDLNIPHMFYCSYDGAGNLFLDGLTKARAVVVGELAKGASGIQTLTLDQAITGAGGVQWDGTNLAVGDVSASVIYRFKITSGKGTKVGSTPLNGSAFVDEFRIVKQTVVVPDYINGKVRFYKYPAGGSATKTIAGFTGPIATTVSE